MKTKFLLLFLLMAGLFAQAQMRYFHATLQGTQEVPPNASTASGVVLIAYDMATNLMKVYGDYQNLTTAANASHVHGPAPAGSNAAVLFAINNTGGTTGTLSGSSVLSDANETELLAGNLYVNVHNVTYPGGEIRGQITATHPTDSYFFNGRLQGAQQVPPNGSTASGNYSVILDVNSNIVYLTGSFTGLATPASAAHIHNAPAGTNSGVIIPLTVSAATSGTIHVISGINTTNRDEMLNGNTYVNIHNATYPGGEIRGQVSMLSQLSFFKAVLQGNMEVPPNASTAKGTVIVKYNNQTNLLELIGDYQGIAATITGSHIHSPAVAGTNASVLITLANTGGTSGVLTGSATLTEQQEMDLLDAKMYVNIHNATYPGGEIRGQLLVTSAETQYFKGFLSGSQENPAVPSEGSGKVTVLLDKMTLEVFVTGNFTFLISNASAGHVHRGQTGVNGPVVIPLSVTPATTGTITGSGVVSQAFADSMINGFSYVNIHNATYPGGELRGQLGDQVLPLKLTYFNGYKDRNNISLIWESAQEIDLLNYEVEQQDPVTKRWITKTSVKAKGGNLNTKYNVSDVPATGSESYVIYRLKMIDKNGSFTYSNAVRINFKKAAAELTLLSNPVVNGSVRYTISGLSSNKNAEVSVIDFNGRLMVKTIQPSLSTNDINLAGLAPGMYKLVVKVDGVVLQKSFVK